MKNTTQRMAHAYHGDPASSSLSRLQISHSHMALSGKTPAARLPPEQVVVDHILPPETSTAWDRGSNPIASQSEADMTRHCGSRNVLPSVVNDTRLCGLSFG